MATTDIARVNYYEGQYLGVLDFEAQQSYNRDMRRRHNVGHHTWGIVVGLDLVQIPNGNPNGEVDVYVQPGLAVDGFGREIFVLQPYKLDSLLFQDFSNPQPQNLEVWISYDQTFTQRPAAGYDQCDATTQFARVVESFKIVVQPAKPTHDAVMVDGEKVYPPQPPPAPQPSPGDLTVPLDESAPYQELPDDQASPAPLWLVQLGKVKWDYANNRFLPASSAVVTTGRSYVGVVAQQVYAPAGMIRIKDRSTPTNPANETTDLVGIEGSLRVDGLLTAVQEVVIKGSSDSASSTSPPSPLTISANGTGEELIQFENPSNQPTWHINQNLSGNTPGINVGEISGSSNREGRLFIQTTTDDTTGNVGIGTTKPRNPLSVRARNAWDELLSFEDANGTRTWHVNQKPAGVTPGLNICETNVADFRLFIQAGGNVGIGTSSPSNRLHVNDYTGIRQNRLFVSGGDGWSSLTYNAFHDATNTSWSFPDSSRPAVTIEMDDASGKPRFQVYSTTPTATTTWVQRLAVDGTSGNIYMGQNGGDVGIGTTNPQGRLTIRSSHQPAQGQLTFFSQNGDIEYDGGSDGLFVIKDNGGITAFTGGKIGIGTTNPASKLTVAGSIAGGETTTGWVLGSGASSPDNWLRLTTSQGSNTYHDLAVNQFWAAGAKRFDLAEVTLIKRDEELEQGDVVVIDHECGLRVARSERPYDTCVYGIVSSYDQAAMVIGGFGGPESMKGASDKIPIALVGRAKVKASAENGPIHIGDLLTTASTPGHLMKCDTGSPCVGTVAGKALEPLEAETGLITVLVTLL